MPRDVVPPSPRPLSIALLAHSTNPRGGVVHTIELGEALHAAGHRVTVHAPGVAGAKFFRATRCDSVVVPAPPVVGDLAALVEQRIDDYVAYFAQTGTAQWDIVHAQDSISANALAVLRERKLLSGFVRTVHHLDRFEDPRLSAWQTRGVLAADRVLCVSRLWKDALRRSHNVDATVVQNGVDLTRFTAQRNEIDERVRARYGLTGAPLVLAVGGVESRKNSVRIFEAFVELRRTFPAAQLVIVGGASLLDHREYRAHFDEAVRDSGLAVGPGHALVLAGTVADDQMPALYRLADVLAFPSLKEGFGLVVLEAMASGTPVVTSHIAPFTEYLADGDVVWAQPLEPESIANALRTALAPQTAASLRLRGEKVAARFAWQVSAQQHVESYSEWLAEAGRRVHA